MSVTATQRRAAASRLMRDQRFKERDRWIALWNFVLTSELEDGTQFLRAVPDGGLFAVLGSTREVLQLPRRGGERWHAYFHSIYGFAEREKVAGFIYDTLRAHVHTYGERVELRRFAVYNQDTQTAYLSAYNGLIYKIEGVDAITAEIQGIDNVFFADDDGGIGVDPDVGPHGLLLDRIATPNFVPEGIASVTPEQQRMALIIWMFAVAFPDLLPTKPILLLEGIKGSGKTSVISLLQLVLRGMKRPITLRRDREDDFGIVLLRNPIALLDNLDTYVEWLPDAICAYATGGQWERRKLWTDDEIVIIKPHAFVAFTTRNPASFRRDDVVDRCVILRFDRRTSFTRMARLEREILEDRARLLGEYLWYVGRIVDEIRAGYAQDDADEVYRMADFVSFARIVGRVMKWSPEAIDALMRALQAERDAFLTEEDPLIDLLKEWLEYQYNAVAAARRKVSSNRGRLVTVFELAGELESIAQAKPGTPWRETPRSLRLKMRSPSVEAAFTVEQHMVSGHPAFRIWRKSDPRLEVIDGGGVADR
jgi:hypothetical protein